MGKRQKAKWMRSMVKRFGSVEAVKEHMASIGKNGGTKSRGGGFTDIALARRAGQIGGQRSKRPKSIYIKKAEMPGTEMK